MLNVVIFGAPGSGKGTHSDHIVNKYNLVHISSGELLRAEIAAGSEVGKQVEGLLLKGHLAPDDIIVDLLKAKIESAVGVNGFIFDGFPRNVAQAARLDEILGSINEGVGVMLNLDVEEETLMERLLLRGRCDDNRETIANRLKVYNFVTCPVMDYYKSKGSYVRIDNNGTIEECFDQIVLAVDGVYAL